MHGKFVAYYRVSTQRQGHSGLGLAAQRAAVRQFLDGGHWSLIGEFTEVESGKLNARPQLAKAMHLAKMTGSKLVIAKLDRLSRNAAFLLALRDSGVKFVAADMPEANDTVIGIMAVIAQDERERISARTKAALVEARKRGVKLGNPRGAMILRPHRRRASALGVQALRQQAVAFARDVAPILADLAARGITTHRAIAQELNRRGIQTARGHVGCWTDTTVARLRRRLQTSA